MCSKSAQGLIGSKTQVSHIFKYSAAKQLRRPIVLALYRPVVGFQEMTNVP